MKQISTTVSTGDKVKTMFNKETEIIGTIGGLKHGKISIYWKLNNTSGFTEQISTRSLNQRIKSNNIYLIQ